MPTPKGEVFPSPPLPGDESSPAAQRHPTRELPAVVTRGDWRNVKRWLRAIGAASGLLGAGGAASHFSNRGHAKEVVDERTAVLEYRIGEVEKSVEELKDKQQANTETILDAIEKKK